MSHPHGRTLVRMIVPVTIGALGLVAAPAGVADWHEPVSGASPINHDAARSVTHSDLTTIDGVPYVAWNEDTSIPGAGSSSTIRVARLAADGTTWDEVAGAGLNPISRLSSTSSENPSIADVGGRPWVAWEEGITATNSEIRVARLNSAGTAWEKVPDALRPVNHLREDPGGMASTPTLVTDGGDRPYVSFFESDPGSGSLFFGPDQDPAKIYVMRLDADGTGWDEVGGGPVNPLTDFDAAFPTMTLVDGVPYVSYFQVNVVGGAPEVSIRISRLDDLGQWEQVGPPLVAGAPGDFDNPTITTVAGTPYAAFTSQGADTNARVRVFGLDPTGDAWEPLGTASPAGKTADDPSLTGIGDELWASWRQRSGASTVGAAVLRGGEWQPVASAYQHAADVDYGPALADVHGIPWYSFAEADNTTPGTGSTPPCCDQLRVARLEPDLGPATSQPGDDNATLMTTVEDYGLPYAIGFQYGPEGDLSQQTPREAATGSLFHQVVTGLTPSSVYGFQPVAEAGTPLPLVRGATSYFVTDPADQPDPLVVAITRAPRRVHRGDVARIRFFTTQPGEATLRARRDGRTVGQPMTMTVDAGTASFRWLASVRPDRYRLVVRVEDGLGRRAGDGIGIRVLPRR